MNPVNPPGYGPALSINSGWDVHKSLVFVIYVDYSGMSHLGQVPCSSWLSYHWVDVQLCKSYQDTIYVYITSTFHTCMHVTFRRRGRVVSA